LFQSQSELEKDLKRFLDDNPAYRGKRLTYIGLHSTTVNQGEIFWEPDGHTILKNLTFLQPDTSASRSGAKARS
jgi:hypothetical protein